MTYSTQWDAEVSRLLSSQGEAVWGKDEPVTINELLAADEPSPHQRLMWQTANCEGVGKCPACTEQHWRNEANRAMERARRHREWEDRKEAVGTFVVLGMFVGVVYLALLFFGGS